MKKIKVVLLAGQSNAVGVGHCAYLPRHFSPEKVQEYQNGYQNVPISYYSHDKHSGGFVKTGLNCTELTKDTFGPELGIAEMISQKYPGEHYAMIKCAYGGTSLWHDWLSPSGGAEYDPASHDDMERAEHYRSFGWCYNELMKILPDSLKALEQQGYTPEIVAWCWMQGEGDADIPEHVAGYERRYVALLTDIHAGFGKYFAPDCAYIDGGISEIWTLYRELNEVKHAYAKKTPNSYFLDTVAAGLSTQGEPEPEPDIYHYNADSTIKLGHLFAEHI